MIRIIKAFAEPVSWAYDDKTKRDIRYSLYVLVDHIPEEFLYDVKGNCFWAERDGLVQFYYWVSPVNNGGYCGEEFTVKLKSGKSVTLKGPWSSRAGVMNKMGFPPCVEVALTDEPEVMEKGYTFTGGYALTLPLAMKAGRMAGFRLEKKEDESDLTYELIKS